jgi:starch synthase
MHVLSVASEVYPLVKTGGLADVTGALPHALASHGVAMRTLVPGYPAIMKEVKNAAQVHEYADLFGGAARVIAAEARGLDVLVLDAPHLFDRPGSIYLGPDGKDWPDNVMRYGALSQVAADIGRGMLKAYQPDILHLHDWQAALAATHVRYNGGPKTVVTVHNIAFQGVYPPETFGALGLPQAAFAIGGVEYYAQVSFLKGGLACADAISTVSPTYAREICSSEFGMGMDGLLRSRRSVLSGIVNGIDTGVWNPATDAALQQPYDATAIGKRTVNKRALEQRFGLEKGDGILHGVVSRLTGQKGLDVLADLTDWLVSTGARLALIGTGDPAIEDAFKSAIVKHKGRIGGVFGYDEGLSHLVQGGADTILVPSRFEPCGLTQLYGLRYGCIPVVARTGGLADTIIDANEAALTAGVATGMQFSPVDRDSLQMVLARAAALYSDRNKWSSMQQRAMAQDVTWSRSAKSYADLYREILKA